MTYILVWIISLGSLGLYLMAYLFPEVHRKNDFIWGGVGLFYALILLAYAKTMPGGLLIGQIASVSLIVWLGQQTLRQRQLLTPEDAPRPEPGSVSDRLRGLTIRAWKLVEPLVVLISGFVAKLLEKPQVANISEIQVDAPDAAKPTFLNQLTDPLANLSGNFTGLFKSKEQNIETVNTVTVKATPAQEAEVKKEVERDVKPDQTEIGKTEQTADSVAPETTSPIETNEPPSAEEATPSADKIQQDIANLIEQDDSSVTSQSSSNPDQGQTVTTSESNPESEASDHPQSASPKVEMTVDDHTVAVPAATESTSLETSNDSMTNEATVPQAETVVEPAESDEQEVLKHTSSQESDPSQPETPTKEWTSPDPLA